MLQVPRSVKYALHKCTTFLIYPDEDIGHSQESPNVISSDLSNGVHMIFTFDFAKTTARPGNQIHMTKNTLQDTKTHLRSLEVPHGECSVWSPWSMSVEGGHCYGPMELKNGLDIWIVWITGWDTC